MTHAARSTGVLALIGVIVASSAAAGCRTCVTAGCDAVDVPVSSPGISQGIAGFAAEKSDVCDACCECPLARHATIFVFPTGAPVTSEEDADRVVRTTPADTISFDHRGYEEPLAAGDFLACMGSDDKGPDTCAPVKVLTSEVTSVHLRFSTPGRALIVITPDGEKKDGSLAVSATPCSECAP